MAVRPDQRIKIVFECVNVAVRPDQPIKIVLGVYNIYFF